MAANPKYVLKKPYSPGKTTNQDIEIAAQRLAEIERRFNQLDEHKVVELVFTHRPEPGVVEDLREAVHRSVRGDDGPPYRDRSQYPYRAPLVPDQPGVR